MVAKQECEKLLNALMPFAKDFLGRNGQLAPVGAILTADQKVQLQAADPGSGSRSGNEIMKLLVEGIRDQVRKQPHRATAIVSDRLVTVPGENAQRDALVFQLDHVTGYSVFVAFPYRRSGPTSIELESPFATEGPANIFPAAQPRQ